MGLPTPYSNIFTRFLRKIYDINIANDLISNTSVAESQMTGYIDSAIENYPQCLTDLTDRDDVLMQFNQTLASYDEEIIAIFMVAEWLSSFISSILNLQVFLNDREFTTYSQANFLNIKKQLKQDIVAEAEILISKHSYANMDYTQFN
jgi:hypothetical protein